MLQVRALRKAFHGSAGQALFGGVELDLAAGECVAIVGESGAGKSTLLNCLAGLEPVDGGSIRLAGQELSGLDDDAWCALRRRRYGFVFQAFHILPHLNVAHNVALPLWLLDADERAAHGAALHMLEQVGLGGRGEAWPAQLSGGELQRVAIARALVHGPALVLADEPTGNLDPARAGAVLDVLLGRVREAGAAMLLVTHSANAAARADRVLRLTGDGLVAAEAP
ncbi:ABC transporter ATP-binding protein [Pseudothauera lacus]|uniref:ABC transporter ATP-binding protein n=1 Tax=Pseudothauera lacus TaxID=2136175 RepID=A0A2T4IH44_9RHOO|nr:ABC transporter ATP-binding protein [Pseudothauera lacus]PTD97071.1 ABC transporter ATP-binding protein [Pseudothauera lacus]